MNRIPENLRRRKDNRPNRFHRARVIEKCRCARHDYGQVPRARGGAAFFSSGALAVGDLLRAIVTGFLLSRNGCARDSQPGDFSPRNTRITRKASVPDLVSEIVVSFRMFSGPKKASASRDQ